MAINGPTNRLLGRRSECERLEGLLASIRGRQSGVLVVRGEPGVGKSALLEYAVESATECAVARAVGVESEMELPFAALHQLCAAMLDRLPALPDPQREALGIAFGLRSGSVPDRFLVGLAVLSLLCEAAEKEPLLCVVDDAQWLDHASAQALAFVARRLLADPVGLVFASREPHEDLAGLSELVVEGLGDSDARALLGSVIGAPQDVEVRNRIIAETHGNPLAILEWTRGLTPAELSGVVPLVATLPLTRLIEEGFRRRLEKLPPATQQFLLVAAAEPVGDPGLVWRAAAQLGIRPEAVSPSVEAGLIDVGIRIVFRHPLVRSATYRSARLEDRQRVHQALADATDPEVDPDRRAWHRAQAIIAPNEDVALELERSAERAKRRGGLAAAAAFLERSATLTVDPGQRVERMLAAARAKEQSGQLAAALRLLASTEAEHLDDLGRARVAEERGRAAFFSRDASSASSLLLEAAKQFESLDVRAARQAYLAAFVAAAHSGSVAQSVSQLEVAQAARLAPRAPHPASASDLLLDALALHSTEGTAAAAPTLRQAINAFCGRAHPLHEELDWLSLACAAASLLWDNESWRVLAARHVQITRDRGALNMLPLALNGLASYRLLSGDLGAASSMIAEARTINEVTGSNYTSPFVAMNLAALRGGETDALALIEASIQGSPPGGQGNIVRFAQSATATLYNGLARYDLALTAAENACHHMSNWGTQTTLPELIEAAVRNGTPERASAAFDELSGSTMASGTDWALGIRARSCGLLGKDGGADDSYREALRYLSATGLGTEIARTHLLYGEWLRRERRRLDAREQLRTAHEMFTTMGADGFAERARIELVATGETARKRVSETSFELTAQEAQVCRFAADGSTNAEIAARLFISANTVDYHLRKAFRKLGVKSRTQLAKELVK